MSFVDSQRWLTASCFCSSRSTALFDSLEPIKPQKDRLQTYKTLYDLLKPRKSRSNLKRVGKNAQNLIRPVKLGIQGHKH